MEFPELIFKVPISGLFMFFIFKISKESILGPPSWWIISFAGGSEYLTESSSSQKLFNVVKTKSLTQEIKFSV